MIAAAILLFNKSCILPLKTQILENMHNQDDDLFPNDDVLMQILSHLPLKSIFRFRIIKRSYQEMIDSSGFRKLLVENQLCNNFDKDEDSLLLQFFYDSEQFIYSFKLQPLHTGKSHHLYDEYSLINNAATVYSGPLHGLICFYREDSTYPIALCNPFLREIKILPPSPSPIYGTRTVGFGYDDLKKDFKIVQIFSHPSSLGPPIVEVYSINKNKWRGLPKNPLHKCLFVSEQIHRVEPVSRRSAAVAHWKGSAAWRTRDGECIVRNAIVSFDMRNEALKTIMIPFLNYSRIVKIFAKEGSFMMFTSASEVYQIEGLSIWEYKTEWIKVGNLGTFFPTTTWKSNGLFLKIHSRKFALYDICSGRITLTFEYRVNDDYNMEEMVEYRGSLISPLTTI